MGNWKLLFLAIYSTGLLIACRMQKDVTNVAICENGLFSEFSIKEENIDLSVRVYSCYDNIKDSVEYVLYIKNNSSSDTNITSLFIPSLHGQFNCSGTDTLSFMYPFYGGHPYQYKPEAGISFDWPGLNAYFLLPKQRKVFLAGLGSGQFCTLEYRVFSSESGNGYSFFVTRSQNGRTALTIKPINRVE